MQAMTKSELARQRQQDDLSAESARHGPRILIVEDDFEIARMLGDTLAENGMIVEIVGNGMRMNAATP